MSIESHLQRTKLDVGSMGEIHFSLYDKTSIGTGNDYVLDITVADDTIAASLSDLSIRLLKVTDSTVTPISKLNAHKDTVTGIKFSRENNNLLFSSSKDGRVRVWDTRMNSDINTAVQTFQDDSKKNPKPINCFDLNPLETLLCGGTDQVDHDAFLLFWDRRKANLLGGYWDSHTDDITEICYHPEKKDLMISGGVDGLINIFDVSQNSEEDALVNTINTETSVGKLSWTNEDVLTCITHTEEMQIWDSSNVKLIHSYTREDLKNDIASSIDYIVDVLNFPDTKEIMLMTGTSEGQVYVWCLKGKDVSLWTVLEKGHCDVIRSKALIGDKIMTGGEDGVLCLWKKDLLDSGKELSALKQKRVHHHKKPY